MDSKYLEFKFVESKPKTQVWNVLSKSDGVILGTIKWFGRWRGYCFFPNLKLDFLVFSSSCMKDILEFMDKLKWLKNV